MSYYLRNRIESRALLTNAQKAARHKCSLYVRYRYHFISILQLTWLRNLCLFLEKFRL